MPGSAPLPKCEAGGLTAGCTLPRWAEARLGASVKPLPLALQATLQQNVDNLTVVPAEPESRQKVQQLVSPRSGAGRGLLEGGRFAFPPTLRSP